MMINGKQIAEGLCAQLRARVGRLPARPVLCDVWVGDDPATASFVRSKRVWAERCGIDFRLVRLAAESSQQEVEQAVREAGQLPDICGVIVQLPLPASLNQTAILNCVDDRLDVDCLGDAALAKFYETNTGLVPPTAGAVMHILSSLALDLANEKILLVGRGALVGRPVARLLTLRGLNFITATRATTNLERLLSEATVVITGVGKPALITDAMLPDGAVVIDAGTAESAGTIQGDVAVGVGVDKLRYYTPVPGGVGPVTVAMLLQNTVGVAERKLFHDISG